jgi:hypothetical protein
MSPWLLLLVLASPPAEFREHQSARADRPPVIDGDLSDPAWQRAEPAGGFTQHYPDTGKEASFQTDVRVLHDAENLYIGAVCHDPEPEKIVSRVTRRDRWVESDWFEVHIDSRRDHRTGLFFTINTANVQMDGSIYDENVFSMDWDGVWESAVKITGTGWNAEMRIPLKLLRFSAGPEVSFGVEYLRGISRLREVDFWSYIPPESGNWVSKFGLLTGLDLKQRPVQVEVIPYVAGRPDLGSGANVRPFDAGVDARVGLGSNFMLTLTANPDFGQVEVDQEVLNLSTLETYYPEKRPFFLEDRSLFQTPGAGGYATAQLFYTRRIGRAPRYPDLEDDEEVVRAPRLPRIYGAAKLAGQTRGGLSIGALQAVTSHEETLIRPGAGPDYSQVAEPLTSFSILRLKQDFWHHSSVGLMTTAVATPEHGAVFTGGADLVMELFGGHYQLDFLSFASALTEERYSWQDDYVRAALEKDGGLGYGGKLAFSKIHGEHLVGSVSAFYYSPNLALNDLGYLDRANRVFLDAQVSHRRLKPLGPIARYTATLSGWIDRTTGGLNLGDGFTFNGSLGLKSGWGGGLYVFCGWPLCDDRETRTEGRVALCGEDQRIKTSLSFYSDSRKPVVALAELKWNTTEHGNTLGVFLSSQLNLHSRLQIELIPGYERSNGAVRWVDTQELTEGDHFLFSNQKYEYWSVTLRGTYTFTTSLTLQAFSQVFLLGVDHQRKYAAPTLSPRKIHVAGLVAAPDVPDDYDYTASNLNISVVLRWEYLPGSIAYLVYTGAFGDSREVADFRFGDVLNDLFLAPAAHVLLLKISYFWG